MKKISPQRNYKNVLAGLTASFVFAGMFFVIQKVPVFAAAMCVTNPEQGLCPLSVQFTPDTLSVPYNSSTGYKLSTNGSILQYDVKLTDFTPYMIEDGTGTLLDLSYSGTFPFYGEDRFGNTGALTKSVTAYLYAENTQMTTALNSKYISVVPDCTWYFSTSVNGVQWDVQDQGPLSKGESSAEYVQNSRNRLTCTGNTTSCPITQQASGYYKAVCSAAATPTVNVQFSLLDKLFARVFAKGN